jgi:glucose/arabinose dehydrogenase
MVRVCTLTIVVAVLLVPAAARAGVFSAPLAPQLAAASALPAGFTESTVWNGLGNPTVIRFAPDGRVFVASKSGLVNVFDSLADPTPTVYADLRTRVHDYWDRGLLGLALDPGFTTGRPYVYVLYAYDKAPDSAQVPRWSDGCPTPPGPTADGCVVSARLSRLTAAERRRC